MPPLLSTDNSPPENWFKVERFSIFGGGDGNSQVTMWPTLGLHSVAPPRSSPGRGARKEKSHVGSKSISRLQKARWCLPETKKAATWHVESNIIQKWNAIHTNISGYIWGNYSFPSSMKWSKTTQSSALASPATISWVGSIKDQRSSKEMLLFLPEADIGKNQRVET